MPKNKVVINGVTQIDLSPTTAGATDVASGKYFFTADGTLTLGTGSGGGGVTRENIVPQQTITASAGYNGLTSTAVLIEGEDYEYTVNGDTRLGTAVDVNGTLQLGDGDYYWYEEGGCFLTDGSVMYFRTSAAGSYTVKVDKITLSGGGGGGGSYVRTEIVPQQTVTMTTIDSHTAAYLSTGVNILEADAEYIITFNGDEYWYTCTSAWYGNILGDLNYLWGTSTEYPYPFLIQDDSTETNLILYAYDGYVNTNVTVKVEKVELLSGGTTLTTKSITQNGTYSASSDSADGYSSVTVNVAGSSWTKVAETSYQVSTTSTSAATVATWETGHSELWTNAKFIYVRVRDTAGKRAGYFYGSDQFFVVNSTSATSTTISGRFYIRCNSSGDYVTDSTSGTSGYGVYADTVYSDGRIRIRRRYNSSSSLTINGTYKVEVYLLDPAGGVPIFT